MRTASALALLIIALAGCREAGQAPAAPAAPVGPPPAPAITPSLDIGCMAPFTPDMTRQGLAAAFGAQNVVQQTVAGPEGTRLAVTAIYPDDPARRAEVMFEDEAAGTGLSSVRVTREATAWSGPNGLRIGDRIEDAERANGGPFLINGFGWDHGGLVTDWKGGRLGDETPNCRMLMRFEQTANLTDMSVSGDGPPKASDLPAIRAAEPKIVSFGVQWSKAE